MVILKGQFQLTEVRTAIVVNLKAVLHDKVKFFRTVFRSGAENWRENVECGERRWNVGREGGVWEEKVECVGEKVECGERRWSVGREGEVWGEKVECGERRWSEKLKRALSYR